MWTLIASLFGKLIAPLFDALKMLAAFLTGKRMGKLEERNRHHEAWQDTQTRVDKATAAVDRLPDDAVRQRLRERAAGAAGTGDPVRNRDTAPKPD